MILVVVGIALKSSLWLAAAAAMNLLLLRRASAAWRHFVWTLAVVGLVVLPVLPVALPHWRIPVHVATPIAQGNDAARVLGPPAGESPLISTRQAAAVREAAEPLVGRGVSWLAMLPGLYAFGVLLILSRMVVGRITVRRLANRATTLVDPAWTHLLVECRAHMGVWRPVRLLRSLDSTMPMAFGTWRPTILMPSVADTWSSDRRRAVLLHELAHVARRDCLTQMIAAVTCALYWPHPGVWWVARRLRGERELACDDRVLAVGTRARDYAGHLLDLAYTLGGSRAPALTVSMARRGEIEGRMLAALDAARNRATPPMWSRVAGMALAAAMVIPLAAAQATPAPTATAVNQAPTGRPQRVPASRQVGEEELPGTWDLRPSDTAGVVELRLHERRDSSSGFSISTRELEGLSSAILSGAGGPATFRIRRDAGTLTFEGTFRLGVGAGTYSFTPSTTFPGELVKRGFARPSSADLYEFAKGDVGLAFLDELNAQKYAKPDLTQLVSAAEHGVDLDYLSGMSQAGYHLRQIAALITTRDHGVDPAYVRALAAQGLTGLSADVLIRARDHGIDPAYVSDMAALGYGALSIDALIGARDHGIDPAYVRDLRELGYQLTLDELITARDHGVDPEYVRAMSSLGYPRLSLEAAIGARDHGIDSTYVRDLRQLGYTLTLAQLITARDHGIDPDYIRQLSAVGYRQLPVDELITLRDHGVTPQFVREQNDLRQKRLSVDELIRLRDRGGAPVAPTWADLIRAVTNRLGALLIGG
jgi:beta-lactamase regulating signal transducer with metallopeptidase domain